MAQQFITAVHTELTVPLQTQRTGVTFFYGDNLANRIVVEVYKNHALQTLEGEVTGYITRGNNTLVTVTGRVENGKACLDLPRAVYAVVGKVTIAVKIKKDNIETTIALLDAYAKSYLSSDTADKETNIEIIITSNVYVEGKTLVIQRE